MFPFRKLFRLFIVLSFLSFSILSILWKLLSLLNPEDYYSDALDRAIFYGNALISSERFYTDDIRSFKSRISKEIEYRKMLSELSDVEIKEIAENYHRNVTIQWGQRTLLPTSKPLYHSGCLKYLEKDYAVTVSLIIVYHNELAALLIRTLTTVIHRTLPKYLKEIILVDDGSSLNITAEVNQYVMQHRMPVKFLRNEEQIGIAGSRLKGINVAVGEVIVILDSHMEVSNIWLEPLLHIITTRPGSIASPILHMIQETEYKQYAHLHPELYVVQPQKGVGVISMHPYHDPVDSPRQPWEPYPSAAVMGGGLVAFKSTLLEYYPATLQGNSWGVENTRLSYRVWMCAGGAWIAPCSQVLHPNGNDWNLYRYFHDESVGLYMNLIYESVAELINFAELDVEKEKIVSKITNKEDLQKFIWDMSDEIRSSFDPDKRNCKGYNWYKENLILDLFSYEPDQFDYVGAIRSVYDSKNCLEVYEKAVAMYRCRDSPPAINDNHIHGFTRNGNVRNGYLDGLCWDSTSPEPQTEVSLFYCHVNSATIGRSGGSQQFEYVANIQQIRHSPSDRCLEYIDGTKVWLMKCNKAKREQRWQIDIAPWFSDL